MGKTATADFATARLAEIRNKEKDVAKAESHLNDCKEAAKAAKEAFDTKVEEMRDLIRIEAPLLEQQ